jgi:hypothetical protein
VYVQGGFLLWLLAILIQTIGMTLFGLAIVRSKALRRGNSVPLLIGVLLIPSLIVHLFVFERSDGSVGWAFVYVGAVIPYALCWIVLGLSVWSPRQAA